MPVSSEMLPAYEIASSWRPSRRASLLRNDLQQIMALPDGNGIAVYNDAGEERVVRFDVQSGELSPLAGDIEPLMPAALRGIKSPCGRYVLDVREHNLWLIHCDGSVEIQLTTDGTAEFAYGRARQGRPHDLDWSFIAQWSPDGRYAATQRLDLRGVREVIVTESAPRAGGDPVAHAYFDTYPGDEHVPMATLVIVDTENATVIQPNLPPIPCTHTSPIVRRDVWWNTTADILYLVLSSRDWCHLSLVAVNPANGAVTTLIHEEAEKRIRPNLEFHQPPTVAVNDAEGKPLEALWFGERDGWGHLYLYDLVNEGEPRLITDGALVIASIQRVDWSARLLWANVAGLITDDPYRETMCRFDLTTGSMTKLYDDDHDHRTVYSPIGIALPWYVDAASTVTMPPRYTVRDWDGNVLVDLGNMDIGALEATGWRAPERFAALAEDGTTTVYGTLYYPPHFDETQVYPVIDHVYPGPQMHRAYPWFHADDIEPYVALGMVGVTIDGRGTPGRDRAFYDHSWRNVGAGSGLADHVSAIRELAAKHAWINADNVSVHGRSAGGFATARAMELFPDFYKVGIAAAGRFEGRMVMSMILEAYDDPYDAEVWACSSAVEAADQIVGKFLIVHGEMDVDCTIFHAYRLIDRMIAANRDFDLLVIPGDDHTFTRRHNYVERRIWDYLTMHALGKTPPARYQIMDERDTAL